MCGSQEEFGDEADSCSEVTLLHTCQGNSALKTRLPKRVMFQLCRQCFSLGKQDQRAQREREKQAERERDKQRGELTEGVAQIKNRGE